MRRDALPPKHRGACGTRTRGLLHAMQTRYQLRQGPMWCGAMTRVLSHADRAWGPHRVSRDGALLVVLTLWSFQCSGDVPVPPLSR